MKIELIRASLKDAKEIWKMQVKSFKNLLDKYQDFETNPASETILNVEMRLKQNFTFFYFIFIDNKKVGAIRVVDCELLTTNTLTSARATSVLTHLIKESSL